MLGIIKKIFGTQNERVIKQYIGKVNQINALEGIYEKMSDDELKSTFNDFKKEIRNKTKSTDNILNDVFAIVRETGKRTTNMRIFDVQMIGGIVLNQGDIAEMKTGEGKTLVATLPAVLNAMSGDGVHVVTVNDYLAHRDATDMSVIYNFLGLSVGVIAANTEEERKAQYNCDITYGTNNEYGFDYLRDNMRYSLSEKIQRNHNFVIVDEVDSILIDEARTPLIISGPTDRTLDGYKRADNVAQKLQKDIDFKLDEKNRTISLSEEGNVKAEKLFEVDNLYSIENAILSHHLDQALKARYLFEIDVDYVVKDGDIIIVDEFTGRLSEGRRFSEGLHQALEAKERVKIKEESQTLADITFQNYFRQYKKLAGMTGTAQTEATEFAQIYSLDVLSIPTNLPMIREDKNDLIYKTEKEKFEAVIVDIKKRHKKGQPVLVGTASIEKSELLHSLLKSSKIPHSVLNAKNHEKEAQIVKNAGKKGAITIATNMAGRGVDIKLSDEIKALGGLYIISTERHESRRIDNQLRGRSGRQGDPGESRFFLSLEDNLLRIFGGDKIGSIMNRLGIDEGEHIESRMVTRAVENAQKKVEQMHFESRKHLLEYDDIANKQRLTIYNFRNNLLDVKYDIDTKLDQMRKDYVKNVLFRAEIYESSVKEEMNLDSLISFLTAEMQKDFTEDILNKLDFNELALHVEKTLRDDFNKKMSVVGDEQRREIERILYLQVLDKSWRDHLYQMDILKTGIGLRGYNQKDPLTEYKKESYSLFMELVEQIKFESIKTLQLVQLKDEKQEEENKKMSEMIARMEADSSEGIKMEHASITNEQIVEKKTPRNNPCPCGSGKKYKQCCGKSGPKKGILV
ncbi:MAG: preprotein translocase subunit SecA [Sulfurospirillum sp.]|nr:preprotein translocase subunit SecA [Sulfurospirillum sp.]MBL0703484.1 preprotein translocase subunit SecA [Sulfurospirillum sp.]